MKGILKLAVCGIAFLCASLPTFAQEKGEMYLAGTLDLSVGTQKVVATSGSVSESSDITPLNTSFSIGAEYAYFAAKNFRLALAASYGLSSEPKEKYNNKWYRTNVNVFNLNPNIAYYVKIVDKFYYTPEVGVSFGFGKYKSPISEKSTYTCPYFSWNVYANLIAFEYRVSQHFAMGCGYGNIYYNSVKITDPDDNKNHIRENTFKFDLGTAGIFARYYF